MNTEVSADELQLAVERAFGVEGRPARDGAVHVFDVTTHRKAQLAYAWTSSIEGSPKRRFYTALGKPPINTAADAARAAIVAEHRGEGRK